MDNFVSFIKKAQQKELEILEGELKSEKEEKVASLDRALKNAEEKLDAARTQNKKIKENIDRYQELKSKDFYMLEKKEEFTKEMFAKKVKANLKGKNLQKWLEDGISQLNDKKNGKIEAGMSFVDIKKIKTKHEIRGNKKIDEPGFIFENENVKIDYRISTFIEEKYKKHRKELIEALF